MKFAVDWTAIGILLGAMPVIGLLKFFFFKHRESPSLAFSRVADLKYSSWRSSLASAPDWLHLLALISFIIAFIDPHLLFPKSASPSKQLLPINELSTEGIAIYLVLDQSGSMGESVEVRGERNQKEMIPKIDLLKHVTKDFILSHPSDLMGLVSFARVPRVLVPLTLDRQTLLNQLGRIQVIKNPDEDGTAIGYAIYKTASLLSATRQFADDLKEKGRPPYTIKSAVIIVVTDGFQDPSHLDKGNRLRTLELDDAAAYAKSQNIRLYVINIDPILSRAQYDPQRRQLKQITELTGGDFYLVNDFQQLQDIYAAIDLLEKGSISQMGATQSMDSKTAFNRFSLYPFFIFAGMGFLFLSLFLNLTLLKVTP